MSEIETELFVIASPKRKVARVTLGAYTYILAFGGLNAPNLRRARRDIDSNRNVEARRPSNLVNSVYRDITTSSTFISCNSLCSERDREKYSYRDAVPSIGANSKLTRTCKFDRSNDSTLTY